ncbi:uncharacterized protein LOC118201385 isoform X2 [Stegodyphus dumicola]|uniref:uncharacterized protein LOC118201385 isoform X2 n=1 Tax=Stegodyphus dumicola TaxID=202533 RepID=UPI0015ADF64F|nr:uncharacterized protein LOC118201385 isoform X2 [Stegodyphus dumicola]XP_035229377.1 uncharacterized protein LOC118201385 isoform X2 [Stegodyphus dumicola]
MMILESYGISHTNKSIYQSKYFKPQVVKRKSAPVCVRLSNSSAEMVLFERKVEIKDLESQVVYLQNQLKCLKLENKTLSDVQVRQEKELRKFKEGVADIPALLKSHKEEVKVLESNINTLRKELKDCQKELKSRNEIVLKKDQQFDKLNVTFKRNEKALREANRENKEIKSEKIKLDDENKRLIAENEELKFKNEQEHKKTQKMTNVILKLEENLSNENCLKEQLKDNLNKLQKKYEELSQNEVVMKALQCVQVSVGTQTDIEKVPVFFDKQTSPSKYENLNVYYISALDEEQNNGLKSISTQNVKGNINFIMLKNASIQTDGCMNIQNLSNYQYEEFSCSSNDSSSHKTNRRMRTGFAFTPLKPLQSFSTKNNREDITEVFFPLSDVYDINKPLSSSNNIYLQAEDLNDKNALQNLSLKNKLHLQDTVNLDYISEGIFDTNTILTGKSVRQSLIHCDKKYEKHFASTISLKEGKSAEWIDRDTL